MAEEQKSTALEDATKLASAAKSASTAAKAAGKAASGNVAGAAIDVLKDPNLRKAIIGGILGGIFMVMAAGMLLGAFLWGAVQYLSNTWTENWNENWERIGINSSGSGLYLAAGSVVNVGETAVETLWDVVKDIFTSEKTTEEALPGGNIVDASNDDSFSDEDVRDTIMAVSNRPELNSAVTRRIDMIKKRCQMRGRQIVEAALIQYGGDAAATVAANWISMVLDGGSIWLYAGIDESSGINVDLSCFELTDEAAIKVLSAYSAQYDCDYSQIEMWSLMDYVGFFPGVEWLSASYDTLDFAGENIYTGGQVSATVDGTAMGGGDYDITDTMLAGETDSAGETVQFFPLIVPRWYGTLRPQYWVEMCAQIKQHNDHYWDLVDKGEEIAPEDELWGKQKSRDANLGGFDLRVDGYDDIVWGGLGLMDTLFVSSRADITFTPVKVEDPDWFHSGLAEIGNLFGASAERWAEVPGSTDYTDGNSNEFTPTSIRYRGNGDGLVDGDVYSLVMGNTCVATITAASYEGDVYVDFTSLTPSTTYTIYHNDIAVGSEPGEDAVIALQFVTPRDPFDGKSAFKLAININISFQTRSMEDIAQNVIGLWSGPLTETETGSDGREYQKGQVDNPLLALTYDAPYTDSDGVSHDLELTRLQGNQFEAYQDMVYALADTVGVTVEGTSERSPGYGMDFVETALSELEYYTEHHLYEGGRYWDGYNNYTGGSVSANTAWCVCFLYYVGHECGYIGPDKCLGSDWLTYVPTVRNWFSAQGRMHNESTYVPSPGDWIFFSTYIGGSDHIGMVMSVNEDGTMNTIEGNSNNILRMGTYSGYATGTYAYTYAGKTYVISGYANPDYPASYPDGLIYNQIPGTITSTVNTKRLSGSGTFPVSMCGLPRFTDTQFPAVVAELERYYPEYYREEMADTSDWQTFSAAWNEVARADSAGFKAAQMQIAAKLYVRPAAEKLRQDTGFNWLKTDVRQEYLWGIVTATPNQLAARQLLEKLSEGLEDNATDIEVATAIQERMADLVDESCTALWGIYGPTIQSAWKTYASQLADRVLEAVKGGT